MFTKGKVPKIEMNEQKAKIEVSVSVINDFISRFYLVIPFIYLFRLVLKVLVDN